MRSAPLMLHAISDPHLGKPSWSGRGRQDLAALIDGPAFDVLLINGDLGETTAALDDGLELIARIPATHKLWVCGNNDLDKLRGNLRGYPTELAERIAPAGCQLLDLSPVHIGRTAFVGSMGWYDGSLWRPHANPPASSTWPNTHEQSQRAAEAWFQAELGPGRLPHPGYTSAAFFAEVQDRLASQLARTIADPGVDRIVVITHMVTAPDFVLFDHNPQYSYLNWFMGFEGAALYRDPKVVLGLVGHTHRHLTITRHQTPVRNISGWEQPVQLVIPPAPDRQDPG